MRRQIWLLGMAGVLALWVGSCGAAASSAREVRLTASEMRFEPSVVRAQPGEKIRLTIQNRGAVDHEFESEALHIDEVLIPPGRQRSVLVTLPARPGEYEYFCDAPGHREAGMVGRVVVQDAPEA